MLNYYRSGNTLSYAFRKEQLQRLKEAVQVYEKRIFDALYKDLHKAPEESFSTEVGLIYAEINYALKHLVKWMDPKKVHTPLTLFPSTSKIIRDPWGVTLIVSPWNYPVLLLIGPLIGAIAGGNCALLKPSEFTVNTSEVIAEMIAEYFPAEYITVVQGDGASVVPQLMNEHRFDYVFFTGSIPVGKAVAKLAAEKLVPVTLELGGKSPCVIADDADISTAAKRVMWGKFTNAGQTCVAPDYLLVHQSVKNKFLDLAAESIDHFYGKDAKQSPDYGRIINEKRFNVLHEFINEGQTIYGGQSNREELYISPTLLVEVSVNSKVMEEEIFGPVLPVFTYNTDYEATEFINQYPNPLSLYIFTKNKKREQYFTERIAFGGGCVNNTLVHLGNPEIPFGGTGNSGMGQYHGQFSFETFTRPKSILKTSTLIDVPVKYPPYKGKMKWLRRFLK
ncbi:MAG: aldehyde dehydrogenase [Chitinophagaceae bacterium]|nr:aldehyde dehydrogenase [Chitinophagaceae bacterium]